MPYKKENISELGLLLRDTLFINPSSTTELLMLLNSSNSASTSLTLTEEQKRKSCTTTQCDYPFQHTKAHIQIHARSRNNKENYRTGDKKQNLRNPNAQFSMKQ